MPIIIHGGMIIVGGSVSQIGSLPVRSSGSPVIKGPQIIPLSLIPAWLANHTTVVPNTAALQSAALSLASAHFPITPLKTFISAVCKWGGYAGVAGRVFKDNGDSHTAACFRAAHASLSAGGPASAALRLLNGIKGLGQPSFASKHLRFFRPDLCPVLDSILSGSLGYSLDPLGYQIFCNDCYAVAAGMVNLGISPSSAPWPAANVEAAIFSCLFH